MEEVEYLRKGSTLVTSTRVEIGGQTFALRNVGSVKIVKAGTPIFAMLLVLAGATMAVATKDSGARIFGGIVALAAGAWAWQKISQRSLVIVTGGGEVVALKSTDGTGVEALRAAIAQAIAGR